MKKFIMLIMLLIMVAAALEASIITKADQSVKEMEALAVSLLSLIGAVSAVVYAIRTKLKVESKVMEKVQANTELRDITKGLIVKAKEDPIELKKSLVNKPIIDLEAFPNEAKNKLVSSALQERCGGLLGKLGLDSPASVANFVTNVYQGAKPLIKLIGK